MNVVPQYKVIGPYNYDKIIQNIKIYAKRLDIGLTSGKMHLILKINFLCNSLNTLKVKQLASYLFCSW